MLILINFWENFKNIIKSVAILIEVSYISWTTILKQVNCHIWTDFCTIFLQSTLCWWCASACPAHLLLFAFFKTRSVLVSHRRVIPSGVSSTLETADPRMPTEGWRVLGHVATMLQKIILPSPSLFPHPQ